MNPIFTFFFALTFLSACESPMNHRTSSDIKTQVDSQTLPLEVLKLNVEIKWIHGPMGNVSVKNHLLVILKDEQGALYSLPDDLSLGFYATMPSMGHPLDDPGFFEDIGEGLYLNKSIRYNMPGDWKNEIWVLDQNFNIKDKVEWDDFF